MNYLNTYSTELTIGVIGSLIATAIVFIISWLRKWPPIPVPLWVIAVFIAFPLIWYVVSQNKYKKLTPVVDESFVTQRVVLDGKKFIRCNFDRCSLVFNGNANFGLEHCNFTAPRFIFEGNAGITMAQISKMSNDPTFAGIIETTMNEYKNDKKQEK